MNNCFTVQLEATIDYCEIDRDLVIHALDEQIDQFFAAKLNFQLANYDWISTHRSEFEVYTDKSEDELNKLLIELTHSINSVNVEHREYVGSHVETHGLETPPYETVHDYEDTVSAVDVSLKVMQVTLNCEECDTLEESKKKKELPYTSLNPNAGNVEHNIEMFNKMNNPSGTLSNNPISGPMSGNVCLENLELVTEDLNDAARERVKDLFNKLSPICGKFIVDSNKADQLLVACGKEPTGKAASFEYLLGVAQDALAVTSGALKIIAAIIELTLDACGLTATAATAVCPVNGSFGEIILGLLTAIPLHLVVEIITTIPAVTRSHLILALRKCIRTSEERETVEAICEARPEVELNNEETRSSDNHDDLTEDMESNMNIQPVSIWEFVSAPGGRTTVEQTQFNSLEDAQRYCAENHLSISDVDHCSGCDIAELFADIYDDDYFGLDDFTGTSELRRMNALYCRVDDCGDFDDSIEESYSVDLNWFEDFCMEVIRLLDIEELGEEDWIEVNFGDDRRLTSGARYRGFTAAGSEYERRGTMTTSQNGVIVKFNDCSESTCSTAQDAARFIARKMGVEL